jgi:membrane protease YdiL (CAAX protease family)
MASTRTEPISTPTVLGLVAAIAAADVVANALAAYPARVPVKLAILVALVGWAHRSQGLSWDELGMERAHLGSGLRLGVIAAAVVAATITVLVLLPSSRSFFESADIANDSHTRKVLMAFVIIPIGTALFEETIFRGVLLGVLLRSATRHSAVILSSVLFGFWHLLPALQDAKGESGAATVGIVAGTIAVTTAAGVVFAWLRLRSESLAAPVLAHIATNSVTYVGAVLALHL